jgi:glycosyltransferase involved in cell wall biosynthesis
MARLAKVPKILGIGAWQDTHIETRMGAALRAVGNTGRAITCTVNFRGVDDDDYPELLAHNDLVIIQYPHTEFWMKVIPMMQKAGTKVVIEHDDHPFFINPENEAYDQWGLRNKKAIVGPYCVADWQDGKNFSIKKNRRRKRNWLSCLKQADGLITTTERLADLFKSFKTWRYDKPVHVIPNFLDFDKWRPLPRKPGVQLRIGYMGGSSHFADMWMIKPALEEIAKRHRHAVRFVIFGPMYPVLWENIPHDMIEWHEPVGGNARFIAKFRTLNLDVGLAPITPDEFNATKSCLKWVQYASQGVPCIASNHPPYSDAISMDGIHGDSWDGMLCSSVRDWVNAMHHMVIYPGLREQIGRNAYAKVTKDYDVNSRADEIMDVYQRIIDGAVQRTLREAPEASGAEG